jgi:hypothetical protein
VFYLRYVNDAAQESYIDTSSSLDIDIEDSPACNDPLVSSDYGKGATVVANLETRASADEPQQSRRAIKTHGEQGIAVERNH